MTDPAELARRLREHHEDETWTGPNGLFVAAATLIETQAREIAELRAAPGNARYVVALNEVSTYLDREIVAAESTFDRRLTAEAVSSVRGWLGAAKAVQREIARLKIGAPSMPTISCTQEPTDGR